VHRPTALAEPVRLERSLGPSSSAVVWEGSTLDELADLVYHRAGYPDALWGSTPIGAPSCARTSVPVGSLPLAWVKDTLTLSRAHTSFESLRARRSLRRVAGLENKPTLLMSDRTLASDPYPGALEALSGCRPPSS
jgi:hypothetical protein